MTVKTLQSPAGTYTPVRPLRIKEKDLTPAEQKLRKTAQQLVAETFFAPMLKEMRDSPFKDTKFSGGRGGEAFSAMLDQQMTKHAASGAGGGLVDAVVRKFHNLVIANETAAARNVDTTHLHARETAPVDASPSDASVKTTDTTQYLNAAAKVNYVSHAR